MKKSGFLQIYIIVMVIATIAGGYLVWSSKSKYKSSKEAFENAESEVKALKSSKIYPSPNNLKEKEKKVSEYVEAVNVFKAKVLDDQASLKGDFTEQNFRKLMEEESAGIAAMAEEKKLVIPEEFAFGMEAYNKGKQVQQGALSRLEWELNAIKRFVNIAAVSGVDSIDDFSRDEFSLENELAKEDEEEENQSRANRRGSNRRGSSSQRRSNDVPVNTNPMKGAGKVMETYRFTSEITASYEALTALLNGIAADKNYFLWLRKIRIENEKQISPREGEFQGGEKVQGALADQEGNVPTIDAQVLFGDEKMKARLFIDAVRFTEKLESKVSAETKNES
jgi:hypothetical protein